MPLDFHGFLRLGLSPIIFDWTLASLVGLLPHTGLTGGVAPIFIYRQDIYNIGVAPRLIVQFALLHSILFHLDCEHFLLDFIFGLHIGRPELHEHLLASPLCEWSKTPIPLEDRFQWHSGHSLQF